MPATLSLLCALAIGQAQPQAPGWTAWAPAIVNSSVAIRTKVPVINQIVIVPDLPTMLDELGRWSPEGHWPILIDGEPLNDQFIRRFAPARVLQRERVVQLASREVIEDAVGRAWDTNEPAVHAVAAKALSTPSPGIVLTSEKSPARAAAAILAAGRGQYLGWVEGDFGRSGQRLTPAQGAHLTKAIEQACAATGASWDQLGDDIDTITMCRDLAARVEGGPASQADNASNPPAMAVTDVIGRSAKGARWAFTGWIFGSAARSAWAANCSLFLPRTRVWLADTYPDKRPWTNWKLDAPARLLQQAGYKVQQVPTLTINTLLEADTDGLQADLVLLTSKGNADFFRMADDQDADAAQVPLLRTPAAVYMVHSWSLRAPYDARTVGGRWLANGAYADIGSSQEPGLQAFVPASLLINRVARGMPWLIAGRYWPSEGGAFSNPWRINTVGDPLMIAPPPGLADRVLQPPSETIPDGCIDVAKAAADALRVARDDPSDATFAKAIQLAALAGRFKIAVQTFQYAVQTKVAGNRCAQVALAPAVFEGDLPAALAAAERLSSFTRYQSDLIWAVGGAKLGKVEDPRLASMLELAIDPDQPAVRVGVLASYLRRTSGPLAATSLINRWVEKATSSRQKRELKKLL
ncbi:MAG: hypothetical protein MK101_01480 [Phycisphaerales bacterium]|nr:hypothetical protein [Phycisphaerales bacterium]